jgi:flagellar motor switch protein FliN/FliY
LAEEQQTETPTNPEELDAQVSGQGSEQPADAAGEQATPDQPAAEATAATEQPAGEEASTQVDAGGGSDSAAPVSLPDLAAAQAQAGPRQSLDLLNDVELNVKIELGRSRMLVEDVLRLGEGSVVELDKLAGDPVDVLVNERLVARGEVLVLSDCFCVRINEIISPGELPTQEGVA